MKISSLWLSDYVDLSGIGVEELAERITRSGIEVDAIEFLNKGVEKVVVGYVAACEQHPNADRLNVCRVDVGQSEHLQIVCGAANVAAGQKVPVAIVGAKLPGDFQIKRAKLRGVESQGMICSAKELGLNDRLLSKELQEGILVLPDNVQIGDSILDVLAMNDAIMEFDLTPNRSDCLSMIGAAYETAAILGREVKLPDETHGTISSDEPASNHISVVINDQELCSHYAARYIEGVRIEPSPRWMQSRLMAAGVRPINNVVDITNYVMLEYGQPLHAFDFDQLNEGHIEVRLARSGEKMTTLDGTERVLEPHMLAITDGVKPVALAGVMGGANSEVTEQTTRILLESAKFDGGTVRRTSRQLGMRSEASIRFEKESNPDSVIPALNRAASLLCQYAGGRVADGIVEAVGRRVEPTTITVSLDRVNGYLGTDLTADQVGSIFARLQFAYEMSGDNNRFTVHVPNRRGDIKREVDLIEEIARLHGYDHIPTTLMNGVTTPGSLTKEQQIRRAIRSTLSTIGVHEAITYSFTHPEQMAQFPGLYGETKAIHLAMPMSEERSVLRTSLIPHLLDVAEYNRNRNMEDVALFEIGKAYITEQRQLSSLPEERSLLSILITGKRHEPHWANKAAAVDFYDLKGIFEKVANVLGVSHVTYVAAQPEGFHPGRTAEILINTNEGRERLGWIGQLHPEIQREHDLGDTYTLEIELDTLVRHANFDIEYAMLPRYPSITRDMAIVMDESVPVSEVMEQARNTAGPLLAAIDIFDIFTGDRLGVGKKSAAFSLVYRDPERTLTDDEVAETHSKVVAALEQVFSAELRK